MGGAGGAGGGYRIQTSLPPAAEPPESLHDPFHPITIRWGGGGGGYRIQTSLPQAAEAPEALRDPFHPRTSLWGLVGDRIQASLPHAAEPPESHYCMTPDTLGPVFGGRLANQASLPYVAEPPPQSVNLATPRTYCCGGGGGGVAIESRCLCHTQQNLQSHCVTPPTLAPVVGGWWRSKPGAFATRSRTSRITA